MNSPPDISTSLLPPRCSAQTRRPMRCEQDRPIPANFCEIEEAASSNVVPSRGVLVEELAGHFIIIVCKLPVFVSMCRTLSSFVFVCVYDGTGLA